MATDSTSNVTGLVSGIDYRALVDAIIASEHRPADTAQAQIDLATKRKTAIASYRDLVTTLRDAVDKLRDGSGLNALTTNIVGTGVGGRSLLAATASTLAQKGSYQVEVVSLARAQKLAGTTVADPAAQLGMTGAFTLNGVAISVAATDTLNDVRDKINAANTGLTPSKVSASILTIGPGDSRLVLTSDTAGVAGIAHVDTFGSVLADLGLTGGSEVLVTGTDAHIRIDGIDIVRATNEITDVIPGVTLSLQAEEPGTTVNLVVDRDATAALDAAKAFVDAYNATVKFLKAQQTPGTDTPPLYGDSVLRTSRSAFSRGVVGLIVGDTGVATTGSAAGFSIDKTGVLTLDEAKFQAALAGDQQSLESLFADGTGSTALDTTLEGLLQTNTGTLDTKSLGLDNQVFRLQNRIDQIEARLEQRRAALLSRFAQMEATIGALQTQSSFLTSQSSVFNSIKSSSK
jgi:flagellar hook-associated protein 2